jgi:hypothetical protein
MKNTLKILFLFIIGSTILKSCIVDDEIDLKLDESPYVIGFKNDLAAESYFEDLGIITAEYAIDVLGGQDGRLIENDIQISYEVSSESTATEGEEFNFVNNSGTLTIPAGQEFTNFPLEINTGSLDPNAPTELIIKLVATSDDGSIVSSLNDELAITFVGCQSTVDEPEYLIETLNASGQVVTSGTESIRFIDVNVFKTGSSGPFGPNSSQGTAGSSDTGFTFTDICGDITISSQNLVGLYSNQTSGSGQVDPETGDITMTVIISPLFGEDQAIYQTTYTKL